MSSAQCRWPRIIRPYCIAHHFEGGSWGGEQEPHIIMQHYVNASEFKPRQFQQATPAARTQTSADGPKVLKIGGTSEKEPEPAVTVVREQNPSWEDNEADQEVTPKVAAPRPPEKDVIKVQEEEVDEKLVEEMYGKEHINVIFIGHVDAGKSTMGGNILLLTGTVDKRTMEKYEREAKEAGRESWYLSWALDLTKEERSKGKTVEVGRAYFETDKRRFTILDAPGHKSYVTSMIGGASQADVGILVISARRGEYETGFEKGGQTREHAVLAKTQGVNKLIVAVNKMDDPTVEWSKERYEECINRLAVFLKGLGYNPKTDLIFLPCSAQVGDNLKDRLSKEVCTWYDGPSLLEVLDNIPTLERKLKSPLMMPITGKYKDLGTVIEGKVESGTIKKGHSALVMPNKTTVEIVAIYNESENEVGVAASGEQVRLRIRGIEEEDVSVGFVLSSLKTPVHTVSAFEAQIAILELKSILSAGYTCVMHVHTAVEEVNFAALLHKIERGSNRKSKKPPGFATKGMKIIARLESTSGDLMCVERFEDYPQLGRFTLRDQGTTIAIGKITKLLE